MNESYSFSTIKNLVLAGDIPQKLNILKIILSEGNVSHESDKDLNIERYFIFDKNEYMLEFEESNLTQFKRTYLTNLKKKELKDRKILDLDSVMAQTPFNNFQNKINVCKKIREVYKRTIVFSEINGSPINTVNFPKYLHHFDIKRTRESSFLFENQFKDENINSIGCTIYEVSRTIPFSSVVDKIDYDDFISIFTQILSSLALTQKLLPQFIHNNLVCESIRLFPIKKGPTLLFYDQTYYNVTIESPKYFVYILIDKNSSVGIKGKSPNRYSDIFTIAESAKSIIDVESRDYDKKIEFLNKISPFNIVTFPRLSGYFKRYIGYVDANDIMYEGYLANLLNGKYKEENWVKSLFTISQRKIYKSVNVVTHTNNMMEFLWTMSSMITTNQLEEYKEVIDIFTSGSVVNDIYNIFSLVFDGMDSEAVIKYLENRFYDIFYTTSILRKEIIDTLDKHFKRAIRKVIENPLKQEEFFALHRFYSLTLAQCIDAMKNKVITSPFHVGTLNRLNALLEKYYPDIKSSTTRNAEKIEKRPIGHTEELDIVIKKLKTIDNKNNNNSVVNDPHGSYNIESMKRFINHINTTMSLHNKITTTPGDVSSEIDYSISNNQVNIPNFKLNIKYSKSKNKEHPSFWLHGEMEYCDNSYFMKKNQIYLYLERTQSVFIKIKKDIEKEKRDFHFLFNNKKFHFENTKNKNGSKYQRIKIPLDTIELGKEGLLYLFYENNYYSVSLISFDITRRDANDYNKPVLSVKEDDFKDYKKLIKVFDLNKNDNQLVVENATTANDVYSPGFKHLFETTHSTPSLTNLSVQYQVLNGDLITGLDEIIYHDKTYHFYVDYKDSDKDARVVVRLVVFHDHKKLPMILTRDESIYNGYPLKRKTVFYFTVEKEYYRFENRVINIYAFNTDTPLLTINYSDTSKDIFESFYEN